MEARAALARTLYSRIYSRIGRNTAPMLVMRPMVAAI